MTSGATVARIASLAVKLDALLFILYIHSTYIIEFQLLGGIIIIQTLPSVFLGLYTKWLNRWALVIGGQSLGIYSALSSAVLNLVVSVALTPVFRMAARRRDAQNGEVHKKAA